MPCDMMSGADFHASEISSIRREMHLHTVMLCKVMQMVEAFGLLRDMDADVQHWWNAHKQCDQQRLQQEMAQKKRAADRQAAIAKLNDYEKGLLGIR